MAWHLQTVRFKTFITWEMLIISSVKLIRFIHQRLNWRNWILLWPRMTSITSYCKCHTVSDAQPKEASEGRNKYQKGQCALVCVHHALHKDFFPPYCQLREWLIRPCDFCSCWLAGKRNHSSFYFFSTSPHDLRLSKPAEKKFVLQWQAQPTLLMRSIVGRLVCLLARCPHFWRSIAIGGVVSRPCPAVWPRTHVDHCRPSCPCPTFIS